MFKFIDYDASIVYTTTTIWLLSTPPLISLYVYEIAYVIDALLFFSSILLSSLLYCSSHVCVSLFKKILCKRKGNKEYTCII